MNGRQNVVLTHEGIIIQRKGDFMNNKRLQDLVEKRAEKMWECDHDFVVKTNTSEKLVHIDWTSYDTTFIINWEETPDMSSWTVFVDGERLNMHEYEELQVDIFNASVDDMVESVINWASMRF